MLARIGQIVSWLATAAAAAVLAAMVYLLATKGLTAAGIFGFVGIAAATWIAGRMVRAILSAP